MEPMPIDQPQTGGLDGMGPDMEEQPPMDDQVTPDDTVGGSEIEDIFSQLDTEKQAAVLKYAKSMVENVEHGNLVTEIENEILVDREEKQKEKINKDVDKKNNPFVTKY